MAFNIGAGVSYAAEQAGGLIGQQINRDADAAIQSRLIQERAAIEAERDKRLEGYASAREQRGYAHQSKENQLGREFTGSENQKGRDFTSSENQKGRDFQAQEGDKNRELQKQQIGIAGGQLALAREQAQMGRQIIAADGRVAYVGMGKDENGKPTPVITGYLKGADGKDFTAPKNIGEEQKMRFNAISQQIEQLTKKDTAGDPKESDRISAQIMKLRDEQNAILGVTKQADAPIVDPRKQPPKPAGGGIVGSEMQRVPTPMQTNAKPGSPEAMADDAEKKALQEKRKADAERKDAEARKANEARMEEERKRREHFNRTVGGARQT